MLYEQKKSVKNVPNPPRKGAFSVFNNRSEGYADYKPGMYYISVLNLKVAKEEATVAKEGTRESELKKGRTKNLKARPRKLSCMKVLGRSVGRN